MANKEKNNNPKPVFNFAPVDEPGNENDKKVSTYRGKIIHYVTDLEGYIEEILTEYFITDNEIVQYDFMYALLSSDKINLGNKYQALAYIIKNRFGDFETKHPNLLCVLERLIYMRNDIAHHTFINKIAAIPNAVPPLIEFTTKKSKPKMQFTKLNDEELRVFYGNYIQVKKDLNELKKLLWEIKKSS